LIQGVDCSRPSRFLTTCQGWQETFHGGQDNFGAPKNVLLIRGAEQNLVASNANIGVAKAMFFPQISLLGSGGATISLGIFS
jgi:hypothetical protein